jgi:hypothetical protein
VVSSIALSVQAGSTEPVYGRAMDDIDGPFMAKRIYQRIFRNGTLDMGAVPYALEDAARELRELGAPVSRWATYIHMGV